MLIKENINFYARENNSDNPDNAASVNEGESENAVEKKNEEDKTEYENESEGENKGGNKRKREDEAVDEDEGKNLEESRKLKKFEEVEEPKAYEDIDNSKYPEKFEDLEHSKYPRNSKYFQNFEDTENTEGTDGSSDSLVRDPEDVKNDIRMLNMDLQIVEEGKILNDKLPPEARRDSYNVHELSRKGYDEYFDEKNNNTIEEGLNKVSIEIKSILSDLRDELAESKKSLTIMENISKDGGVKQAQTEAKKEEKYEMSGFSTNCSSKTSTDSKSYTGLTPNKDLDDLPLDTPGYTDDWD